MSLDALTLAAIRDELDGLLVGGRVQRVLRPTALGIGLEVYAGHERHQLLLSAEPDADGVGLVDDRLRRGTEQPSPLQLLLAKHVDGSRLVAVTQPPLERVLRLSFLGTEGAVDLVCELMGRLSNLILVDAGGSILDAAHRVPARVNRYRTVLPGDPYVPPPPQSKPDPLDLDAAAWAAGIAAQPGPLHRRLPQVARGISPLIAREIVHRATGTLDPDLPLGETALERLVAAVCELLGLIATHAWAPSVGYRVDGDGRTPVAVAPYALTHLDAWEPVPSISRAVFRPLHTDRPRDPYAAARSALGERLAEPVARVRARIEALERAAVSPEELAELQFQGEAILAMAWAIVPGQMELAVRRGDVTGEAVPGGEREVRIPLDPALSPADNAQAVFRAYRKRQAAGEQVPERIAEARAELAYLEQLEQDAAVAEDRPALDQVEAALREAGYGAGGGPGVVARVPQRQPAAGPLRLTTARGTLVLVGRNSRQNEDVTFRLSGPRDLWLHARGVPGGHVVLRTGGASAVERDVLEAAALAAYHSSARDEGAVLVDVTERRHVHRMPGGRPGMVTYRQESTVTVAPAAPVGRGHETD